jgi:hypothetical protein
LKKEDEKIKYREAINRKLKDKEAQEDEELTIQDRWESIETIITEAAEEVVGYKKKENKTNGSMRSVERQ